MASNWARFWAIDLHVHTPGSTDAKSDDFGAADDIVKAARDAGLDAIAVTDHNTAQWCDQMTAAAAGSDLVVLPGLELSTHEGHLLAIWEEGTPAHVLEDLLVRVGIPRSKFGQLDVVTKLGMADCADEITAAKGLPIPAHIDKERGIMTQSVQTYVNQLLADERFAALEYVLKETPAKVAAKLGDQLLPALVQSSDAYDAKLSRHSATAIGIRRTWIKAALPDLQGIRYALEDPDLRVRLVDPTTEPPHATIDSLSISGGFLDGFDLELSPDVNSLLGGTGAGKSLVLEAVRFVLDQQVDGSIFKAIREEVDRRLHAALREGAAVTIQVTTGSGRYRITRIYSAAGGQPVVEQFLDGDWVPIDRVPSTLLNLAAFSQGEILEYARQPVGRVGLVDSHLDLTEIEDRISDALSKLKTNAGKLIAARDRVATLTEGAGKVTALEDRERELAALFDGDLVKQQGLWTSERQVLKTLVEKVNEISVVQPSAPVAVAAKLSPAHDSKFERIRVAREAFEKVAAKSKNEVDASLTDLKNVVEEVKAEVDSEFATFKTELDDALEKSGGNSLPALRRELEKVQTNLGLAKDSAMELTAIAQPGLDGLIAERETLLDTLKKARDERRALRRTRAAELNKKTANFVKIDIPNTGDRTDFRAALNVITVGSHSRAQVLDLIAQKMNPYRLVRALWSGDFATLDPLPDGITLTDLSRLHTNVADKKLWDELLDCQIVDTPDVLNVKFRKPSETDYVSIEDLSHGQKCTAVLVILLADGNSPVLIDQPEDALHAPWIEEYLVDRLRELRGSRQYLFATRSPGLVVSADSELLITMQASAGKGEIEASGSLERLDLNALALHHLEGGRTPFNRRARKLRTSINID